MFIHGGYWRALDKADFGFVAAPFVARGIAVANVNYDLCPAVTVAAIVDEIRRAVGWVAREGERHGAGTARVVVGGHSAGGHLAAMMVCTDWMQHGFAAPPFHAGVSLSGVHDLTPMPLFSFNVDLRLDEEAARRLSPVLLPVTMVAPLLVAVGGAETGEFIRQARLLWEALAGASSGGCGGTADRAGPEPLQRGRRLWRTRQRARRARHSRCSTDSSGSRRAPASRTGRVGRALPR